MNEIHAAPILNVRSGARSSLLCAAVLAAGWWIGAVASRPSPASAEVINAAPDQHFMSGDQLSLPILQDIANTLHQMDTRLSHLEAAADRLQSDHAGARKPSVD
jgi:hypothetical protein